MQGPRGKSQLALAFLYIIPLILATAPYIFFLTKEAMNGAVEVRVRYEMELEKGQPASTAARAVLYVKTYQRHYWELVHYLKGSERKTMVTGLGTATVFAALAWIIAWGLFTRRQWGVKGAMAVGVMISLLALNILANTINRSVILSSAFAPAGVYLAVVIAAAMFAWGMRVLSLGLAASQPEPEDETPGPPAAR